MISKTGFLLCFMIPYTIFSQIGNNKLFIENKGQWDAGVLFKIAIPGGNLELRSSKFTYRISNYESFIHQHDVDLSGAREGLIAEEINIIFQGSNPDPRITFESPSIENYNYYLGKDQSKWVSGCKAYGTIIYHDLYPGIDLKYYYENDALKYDLILHPGSDPSVIGIKYEGMENLSLEDGCVSVKSRINTITENKPVSFQLNNTKKLPIESKYTLNNTLIGFELSRYDPKLTTVIDPELIFSTFSGSVADNFGYTACFDDKGNLYSGGIVFGPIFPATNGSSFSGGTDMAILKYDSTGSQLLYATFLGGISEDTPHSLIVNHNSELVILGTTGSADYPVSENAYDTTFNGGEDFTIFNPYSNGSDIVLSKLGPTGNLISSTFIGGTKNDGVLKLLNQGTPVNRLIKNYGDYMRGDIIVDENDHVYIASSTESTDFPITSDIQTDYGGGVSDAIIFALDENFTNLLWSTYLGGEFEDAAYSIKFDSSGYLFLGGGTMSPDFHATDSTLNPTFQGTTDGFITKIDLQGDSIMQSTFLGTSAYDQAYFIDIDEYQSVFAFGQTMGQYPVSQGVYNNPNSSQFIHSLSNNLDSTIFSTVFGSGNSLPNISPTAFLANECGNLFLSGWGGSTNNFGPYHNSYTYGMPITENALFPTTDGSDFYLMVLSADGSELLYGTYFGSSGPTGDHVDGGTSRFDKRGIIYQSVCSCNGSIDDFPTTPNAWSTINRGRNSNGIERCNNAAFKFDLASLKARYFTSKIDDSEVGYHSDCIPFSVRFTNNSIGGEELLWTINGETRDVETFDYIFTKTGTYEVTLTVTDKNTCQTIDQTSGYVYAYDDKTSIIEDVTICRGEQMEILAFGGGSYSWEPTTGLNNPTIGNPLASPDTTTTYTAFITTPNGCHFEEEITVHVINETLEEFKVIRENSCNGLPDYLFINNTDSDAGFVWDLGDGTTNNQKQFTYRYQETGEYDISLIVDTVCVVNKTVQISFEEIFVPNVFTPNNDGKNDVFEIRTDLQADLEIFDRSGKKVYAQKNYQNTWNGDDLPGNTYYYALTLSDGDVCNGWVQILR
ncbi:MAG: gliding motility-associated C-terminal domain-containing protein [Bacteroidota bacterium]